MRVKAELANRKRPSGSTTQTASGTRSRMSARGGSFDVTASLWRLFRLARVAGMKSTAAYPIGTSGQPWGPAEVAEWRSRQVRQRSHAELVLSRVERLHEAFDVSEYGRLDYTTGSYPLVAIRTHGWDDARPCMLVTGGVHGYETSGVLGALQFVE